mmetsp:Transcript_4465/g.10923  ORF Transcript_4465/g.10923 Transcript_4465/m.10923 type:complete len:102 (-) Transcript_4465:556-861(-)
MEEQSLPLVRLRPESQEPARREGFSRGGGEDSSGQGPAVEGPLLLQEVKTRGEEGGDKFSRLAGLMTQEEEQQQKREEAPARAAPTARTNDATDEPKTSTP